MHKELVEIVLMLLVSLGSTAQESGTPWVPRGDRPKEYWTRYYGVGEMQWLVTATLVTKDSVVIEMLKDCPSYTKAESFSWKGGSETGIYTDCTGNTFVTNRPPLLEELISPMPEEMRKIIPERHEEVHELDGPTALAGTQSAP